MPTVTEDGRVGGGPGPEAAPTRLLEVLEVRRKARRGVAVGLAVGVLAYLLFVVVRGHPPDVAALYLVSVLVVASATAALVTVALVARTVLRATVDGRRWVRRGGTAGVGGGTLLTGLALAGPVLGRLSPAPTAVYDWLLPVGVVGLAAGAWALHAAHRPLAGYGRLGLAGWLLTAPSALLTWWVVAVDGAVFLAARPTAVAPGGVVGVLLALAGGTSLLGAAALRAGALPVGGLLAALFALPLALGGLTLALLVEPGGLAGAYLDGGPPAALLVLPTAVAWALTGRDLRAGRGVPPAEAFAVDLVPGEADQPGDDG